MDYRYGSHTVYKIENHFVWVTPHQRADIQQVA
jgi:REP element-mobilizing transposase RayT